MDPVHAIALLCLLRGAPAPSGANAGEYPANLVDPADAAALGIYVGPQLPPENPRRHSLGAACCTPGLPPQVCANFHDFGARPFRLAPYTTTASPAR